jgi:hypothetical protein
MHHHEKRLLERVVNQIGFAEQRIQRIVYLLRGGQGAVNAFANVKLTRC